MEPPLPGLIGLVILLFLGTFFATSQTALINARRHLLREQSDRGDRRARRVLEVAEDSTRVLATFQLAGFLTHFLTAGLLIIVFLAPLASLISSWIPGLAAVSTLLAYLIVIPVIAFLIFLLIEVIPTALVQSNAEYWAMVLAGPAKLVISLLSPLVFISAKARRGMASPQGSGTDGAFVTEEEIMTLVDAGEEEGAIEQEEKEMIYSIFRLDETLAREIMLPRIDIVALDINTPLDQAIEVITKAGHSRIPVYEESLDHVKGLLYAKDLLTVPDEEKDKVELKTLLRPASFVPETKGVLDLLRELQSAKVHMTIVIDEYGGTAGLVTIEDIVEEIVGEILDEYDLAEEAPYKLVGDGEYIFDARVGLDNVNHIVNVSLPDELADTLGGFIYGQLGKVPIVGEIVETDQARLQVAEIIDQRIRKVRVTRLSPGDDAGGGEDEPASSKEKFES
ncbi:MAG: HlyC/CorC family transporter [Anaerolineae bacterium]|nr:HlyC/CorC family transporter [Anaerolineae bacterium]